MNGVYQAGIVFERLHSRFVIGMVQCGHHHRSMHDDGDLLVHLDILAFMTHVRCFVPGNKYCGRMQDGDCACLANG